MKKRNFDNLKRSNETIAERSKRLEKMRNFDNLKRSNETIAERSARLEKKRNFDSLKRSNETAIEMLERLGKRENVTTETFKVKKIPEISSIKRKDREKENTCCNDGE